MLYLRTTVAGRAITPQVVGTLTPHPRHSSGQTSVGLYRYGHSSTHLRRSSGQPSPVAAVGYIQVLGTIFPFPTPNTQTRHHSLLLLVMYCYGHSPTHPRPSMLTHAGHSCQTPPVVFCISLDYSAGIARTGTTRTLNIAFPPFTQNMYLRHSRTTRLSLVTQKVFDGDALEEHRKVSLLTDAEGGKHELQKVVTRKSLCNFPLSVSEG